MTGLRVPPGRSGRQWLRHRLTVAERGVGLLEQKLRLLRAEQERLHHRLDETRREWARSAADADTWGLRAGMAAGQRGLRLAAAGDLATVRLRRTSIMGVSYPADPEIGLPDGDTPGDTHGGVVGGAVVGSASLVHARVAYRLALVAAVHHATAANAAEIVDREVAATAQRWRALRKHWIPRLRRALALLELELEELERSEAVRRRWAARTGEAG